MCVCVRNIICERYAVRVQEIVRLAARRFTSDTMISVADWSRGQLVGLFFDFARDSTLSATRYSARVTAEWEGGEKSRPSDLIDLFGQNMSRSLIRRGTIYDCAFLSCDGCVRKERKERGTKAVKRDGYLS